MHEYSLMENVIENILTQLKENPLSPEEKIEKVVLRVGALDIHSEESFCQAFDMQAAKTPLAGCRLQLEIQTGDLHCPACGYAGPCPADQGDGHDPTPVAPCPKCGAIVRITGGRGIRTIDLVTRSGA